MFRYSLGVGLGLGLGLGLGSLRNAQVQPRGRVKLREFEEGGEDGFRTLRLLRLVGLG